MPEKQKRINMGLKTSLGEEGLLVENGKISVKISHRMNIKPALLVDGTSCSLVSSGPQLKPAFHIKLSGFWVTDFAVDWKTLETTEVSDDLGRGERIAFTAFADQHGDSLYPGLKLEARVSLYFYQRFPEVVIGSAEFTNLGEQTLRIDEIVGNYYRLDRRLVSPGAPAWRFASYQGAAYRWGHDYSLIWIESDTDRRNFMGIDQLSGSGGEGGGTPLVDLWTPECGLAVAGVEPQPEWISLPVRTNRDSLVEVCVSEAPEAMYGHQSTLGPGESCTTIRSAFILHKGDFHDAIRTYADLLRAQGIGIPTGSPEAAYAPYWKTWGCLLYTSPSPRD